MEFTEDKDSGLQGSIPYREVVFSSTDSRYKERAQHKVCTQPASTLQSKPEELGKHKQTGN